ncbi:MAG: glycine betaine ABC transporter substrate-binding protein [Sedimenticolaceae bacterium]
MKTFLHAIIWLTLLGLPVYAETVVVGSKKFTESVVLGDIAAQLIQASGIEAIHRRELGGTRVLWGALISGEIDVYAEYSGTLRNEILADESGTDTQDLAAALARFGVRMTPALGFNNTYALGMIAETAHALGIARISDLREHPTLAFGFSNEFMDREDGWPGLQQHYRLAQRQVRGMDHDLAYRALIAGQIQLTDLYSTDAEIPYYGLRVLQDDAGFFPEYRAMLLYRADLAKRAPEAIAALSRAVGRISVERMSAMNARVKLDRIAEPEVAAEFLLDDLGIHAAASAEGVMARLWRHTHEHLTLVGISLAAAILISIPLGILAWARPRLGQIILAAAGILQTIPSLALLVFMIPLLGIGGPPAIVALFLYSLLPIIRNTHAGLSDIPPSIRESAEALGLPPAARLRRIDLPIASRSILAGIKTSAVINVGTATLGALIGAGGFGQPILTGIRLDDTALILQGAVPAAVLALLVQGLFDLAERMMLPAGLAAPGPRAELR